MNNKPQLYQINDFIQWYEFDGLELQAKYQRGAIWSDSAKSFLIDSIMKDYPIPPIFIRQTIDINTKKTFREVIDGQQRLRAILDFYNDKTYWQKNHSGRNSSLCFSDLSDEDQIHFLNYTLFVCIISQEEDSNIYDMFTRLNSNSVPVNKQENRNAKYWGKFKSFVIEISGILRPFFIKYNVFTSKQLVRMYDLEFVSSLIQLILCGIVSETPTSLDELYQKYDKNFDLSDDCAEKLQNIFATMGKLFAEMNDDDAYVFSKTYLYSIFAWLYNIEYGVRDLPYDKQINATNFDIIKVANGLVELNNALFAIKNEKKESTQELGHDVLEFERLHRTRTTSKNERIQRITILNNFLTANYDRQF